MRTILLLALIVVAAFSAKLIQKPHLPITPWQHTKTATTPKLSMFYCGFNGDYCGQSTTSDINPATTNVILAFVNSQADGSVIMDEADFPTANVNLWKSQGKNVLISVGGQNGNWIVIFSTPASITNFVNSIVDIVTRFNLDGVDLDIEMYNATPRTVANAIIQLKTALGNKLLVVSPECVAVYQGVADYSADTAGQAYNYFVNIIRLADDYIDLYQPQAYNNWYDVAGGTLQYLQDVYLNWRNLPGVLSWETPLANFTGVAGNKLMMGVLASTSAGGASYYYTPDTITAFRQWLATNNYPLAGFMMWDSHWDNLNGYAASNACTQ